jgi:hypothetical protein
MTMIPQRLKRRPLYRRQPEFRSEHSRAGRFDLTNRDLDIITSIARHRFMNTAQIVRLWSCDCPLVAKTGVRRGAPTTIEVKAHRRGCDCTCRRSDGTHDITCRRLFKDSIHLATRLRELFQHGYLNRPLAQLYLRSDPKGGVIREGSVPMVYCVTAQGIEAIGPQRRAELGHEKLSWVGKNDGDRFYLQHTLAIGDLSIGVDCAVRQSDTRVRLSDSELCAGMSDKRRQSGKKWLLEVAHKGVAISTLCDLAFGIGDKAIGRRWNFLCEIDMGTMTVSTGDLSKSSILRKMVGYARASFDGHYAKAFGWQGVRVVFLTTSETRVQSMIDAAKQKFGKSKEGHLFLFGTHASSHDLFGYTFRDIDGKPVPLIKDPVAAPPTLFA